jgi:competence protein ComEC
MKQLKIFSNLLVFILIILIGLLGYHYFTPQETSPQPFTLTFLDVGQGDAMIVQCENKTMLIDAGTNDSTDYLMNTLKNMGISRFDMVVGTHPHEDHIGGMDAVINKYAVDEVMMPQVVSTTRSFEDVLLAIKKKNLTVINPEPGNSFNLGSATCTVLAPNSGNYEDLNNYSIVLRVVYENVSFLLTGDAEIESEKEILSKGYNLKSDVLKVGHHGSISSTSLEYLRVVAPRYAIISVGMNNDYQHPHWETLSKLNTMDIDIYRTDFDGNITFTSNGENLIIKTEK